MVLALFVTMRHVDGGGITFVITEHGKSKPTSHFIPRTFSVHFRCDFVAHSACTRIPGNIVGRLFTVSTNSARTDGHFYLSTIACRLWSPDREHGSVAYSGISVVVELQRNCRESFLAGVFLQRNSLVVFRARFFSSRRKWSSVWTRVLSFLQRILQEDSTIDYAFVSFDFPLRKYGVGNISV